MPIYEYGCKTCGTVFEEWHQHADDVVELPCPKCAQKAHRLISNTSFVLKGGGWYVTEYGNRKPEAASSGAKATSPAVNTGTDSAAKTEPAPAKTETAPAPTAS